MSERAPIPLTVIFRNAPTPIEPEPFPIDIDGDRAMTLRIALNTVQVSNVRAVKYVETRQSLEFWQLDLGERSRDYE